LKQKLDQLTVMQKREILDIWGQKRLF